MHAAEVHDSIIPYASGNPLHEFKLRPLLIGSKLIADFAGSESALRTETETIERKIPLCLMDSADHCILIFQLGRLCRDKTKHDLLSL